MQQEEEQLGAEKQQGAANQHRDFSETDNAHRRMEVPHRSSQYLYLPADRTMLSASHLSRLSLCHSASVSVNPALFLVLSLMRSL